MPINKSVFYLMLVAMLSLGLMTSCNKNACEEIDCLNGGTCVDGDCDCPSDWTGITCEISLDPCVIKNCNAATTDTCVAGNNGATCICISGFEGAQCEVPWHDKFLGNYVTTEVCTGSALQFSQQVTIGPKARSITFENFHNQNVKLVGVLFNSTVVQIDPQPFTFGTISGQGSINNARTEIALEYRIISISDTSDCIATMIKQ